MREPIESHFPLKYCITCDTHFYAPPRIHENVEHPNGEWFYVEGDYTNAPDHAYE